MREDWRILALDTYRLAWHGLEEWRKLGRDDLEYWIEELREALLDLKQATVADDEPRALQHLNEVRLLVVELARRSRGDDDSKP